MTGKERKRVADILKKEELLRKLNNQYPIS